uniref:Hemicentin-1-like n=1 Tax=Crassostrea virginica TaxID=6565 RepID=A0A8B8E3Q4_CRAVI|nr:hemicentin-1-like [Crassostrea virginica]
MALITSIKTLFLILVNTIAADDRVAFMGESVSLICQVTNSYSQFVWLKDSNQLLVNGPPDNVLSEQSRILLSIPTPGVRQLTISDVRINDAGSYVCRVTLTDGSQLMSTSHLSVEERLGKEDITTIATDAAGNIEEKVVLVGDTLILPCPILLESSKFGWQKDRVPIAYGPPDTVSVSDGRLSLDNSIYGWRKLIITQVQRQDAGQYLCVVERSFGNPFKLFTQVRVITEDDIETTLGTDTTELTITESRSSTVTKEYVYSTVKTATPKKSSEVNTPASGTGDNKNAAPGKTFYFHGLIIIVGIINNSFLI